MNVTVHVSGVWDPRSQQELTRAVSEGMTRVLARQGVRLS
jgi:hypothetical protein